MKKKGWDGTIFYDGGYGTFAAVLDYARIGMEAEAVKVTDIQEIIAYGSI